MDNSNRKLTHQKCGAGTDEIFQPQLPFYDDMDSFLFMTIWTAFFL